MDDQLELLDARLLQWIQETEPAGFSDLSDRVLDDERAAGNLAALIEGGLVTGIAGHTKEAKDWIDLRCTGAGRRALQQWEASPHDHEEIAILRAAQQGANRGKTGDDLNDHVRKTIGLADIKEPVARMIAAGLLDGVQQRLGNGTVAVATIKGVLPAGSERLSRLAAAPTTPVTFLNSGDISGAVVIGDKNIVSVSIERLTPDETAEMGRLLEQIHAALVDEGDQLAPSDRAEIERQCRVLDVHLESDTPVKAPLRAVLGVVREIALGAAGSGVWQGIAVAITNLVA